MASDPATWEQATLVSRLQWPMHFMTALRLPRTLPPLHTLEVQRAQTDPAFCGGAWVPTWMETCLLEYCAQPQVPIPTKGSSVEHLTTAPYASAWCPDLVAADTEHALRRMVPRQQLLTARPTALSEGTFHQGAAVLKSPSAPGLRIWARTFHRCQPEVPS